MALTSLNMIKDWFKTNLIPTQQQFYDMFDSFRHKSDKVAATDVDGLDNLLAAKASAEVLTTHTTAGNAHATLFGLKVDKVTGKVLSDQNYSLPEKEKLAGIEAWVNAQIAAVTVSSTSLGSITPSTTIPATINVHGFAAAAGTYANCGGMVVPVNSIAFLSRVAGAWTVSATTFSLTEYAKKVEAKSLLLESGRAYTTLDNKAIDSINRIKLLPKTSLKGTDLRVVVIRKPADYDIRIYQFIAGVPSATIKWFITIPASLGNKFIHYVKNTTVGHAFEGSELLLDLDWDKLNEQYIAEGTGMGISIKESLSTDKEFEIYRNDISSFSAKINTAERKNYFNLQKGLLFEDRAYTNAEIEIFKIVNRIKFKTNASLLTKSIRLTVIRKVDIVGQNFYDIRFKSFDTVISTTSWQLLPPLVTGDNLFYYAKNTDAASIFFGCEVILDLNFNYWTTNYIEETQGLKVISASQTDKEFELFVPTVPQIVNQWAGKTMAWFGTSIPGSGNTYYSNPVYDYPSFVATELGCTVRNEAQPASPARRAGANGSWVGMHSQTLWWSLTQTLAEKNHIIDYWETGLNASGVVTGGGTYGWRDLMTGIPTGSPTYVLTDQNKTDIRQRSFETRLVDYYLKATLDNGTANPNFRGMPDLFVLDHGCNDEMMEVLANVEPTSGNVGSGLTYAADNAFNYTATKRLSDGTIISFTPNSYPEMCRNSYIGAMNFLINLILFHNPRASIVIVGHYRKTGFQNAIINGTLSDAQMKIAANWNFPILKIWEKLGYGGNIVRGSKNFFDSFGKTSAVDYTQSQIWMPDNIHPSSDKDYLNKSHKKYAQIVVKELLNVY